jgi:hypothetical protein
MMKRSKGTAVLLAAMLMVGAFATAALAGNPHYVRGPNAAYASQASHNVNVTLKEAGLGKNEMAYYVASAMVSAEWACINGGGKNPSASNKRSSQLPVSTSPLPKESAKNGSITVAAGELELSPSPPTDWSCPNGQREALTKTTYTDIAVTVYDTDPDPDKDGEINEDIDPRNGPTPTNPASLSKPPSS